MAKKKATRGATDVDVESPVGPSVDPLGDEGGETTGEMMIVFKPGVNKATIKKTIKDASGVGDFATSSDYGTAGVAAADLEEAEVLHLEHLGMVAMSNLESVRGVNAAVAAAGSEDSPILRIEHVYKMYPAGSSGMAVPVGGGTMVPGIPIPTGVVGGGLEYVRGYRDAVNYLYEYLAATGLVGGAIAEAVPGVAASVFQDNAQFTWGLRATGVHTCPSRFTGAGIKVAVLDTGLDANHPDFRGRPITFGEFDPNAPARKDFHGHGTHCAGTACGPLRPANGGPRYGVAHAAQLFVGKIFDNANQTDTKIWAAAMDWAVANGCHIVSMSVEVRQDVKIDHLDAAGERALAAGTVPIAAAGNRAKRPGNVGFVTPPANAPAIAAVGALDSRLGIAPFSSRSSALTGKGGKVNIAAPGVQVLSSWTGGDYRAIDGTSQACPHVAGIAALWAQATGERGKDLLARLFQMTTPLNLPSSDVGIGLVQAPQDR